jgi:hypothetical protein
MENLEKIREAVKSLNAEANANWDDDRHIEINYLKGDELDLSIGKFEKHYYTVKVNSEGWRIVNKSGFNKKKESILEDFIHYVVLPCLEEK